jgi:maltose O-acetyltransferase
VIDVRAVLRNWANRRRLRRLPWRALGVGVEWHGGVVSDAPNIAIGDHVYIGPGVHLHGRGGIVIGDGTILGPRVTIHSSNHNHLRPACLPYDGGVRLARVEVGEGVWIGDRAMLCPGVRVGRGSVVAMGSVVSRDVPPFSVVAGNPARVVARREDPEGLDAMIGQRTFYLALKRAGRIVHVETDARSPAEEAA